MSPELTQTRTKCQNFLRPRLKLERKGLRYAFLLSQYGEETRRLLWPRASILHPENVLVIGPSHRAKINQIEIAGFLQRRTGARVAPLLDLGMTIGKREASSAAVIARGIINNLPRRGLTRIATHINDEITIIDAVLPFIQKHDRVRRARINHVRRFAVGLPALIQRMASDPAIHAHAAD